jgi:hypothetical protein
MRYYGLQNATNCLGTGHFDEKFGDAVKMRYWAYQNATNLLIAGHSDEKFGNTVKKRYYALQNATNPVIAGHSSDKAVFQKMGSQLNCTQTQHSHFI